MHHSYCSKDLSEQVIPTGLNPLWLPFVYRMKSKLLKLSFPIPFTKLSKCLISSASLEQHKHLIISFFKICCFLYQKWPYSSSTIPGKSLTGFYKPPQMTSSLFRWSFSRQSLILVFLEYFGGISMKIYPSSVFSWLSYSFDWRTHFSPISGFQTPGTIQGDWVKATQWLAGGRMSCTKVCLVSGTTLEVYTKQFEFLKNYLTDRNEGYRELWHQQFDCLVYLHW